jgi:hypothetical protein
VKYQGTIELLITGPLDDLDEQTDRLADALYDIHDVTDPDLGGSLAAGRLDVTMIVEAEDLVAAAQKALCAVRAAIHAAGDAAPGWEQHVREIGAQARALVDA